MPENASDSPRISFSNDFSHHDSIPIEQRPLQSPFDISNFYWGFPLEFSIARDAISGESSWSAEEFFNDGKILPIEMKKIPEPIYRCKSEKYKTGLPKPEISPIDVVEPVFEIEEIGDQEDEVKLPLLPYNSTGSNSMKSQVSSSSCSSYSSSLNGSVPKPILKKNHGGYNYKGNGGVIRVSSFLDMVPSGDLFGLGSINFDGGRKKNKIRSMFFYW
ncbi:unnamed protein product [Arabidopsis lyrata]|uniref:uncharacterized protein LOC9306921 n=1 Tax=Arabidopsis lyrata subsp. lyrata TaxID=81972 RepID=UPI000A29B535|nr:uncharacterized protein LOC9306921 [Arabidopsis lyrata subsp. lyrata]CAH8277388.1 unnamed protein product [Arabidopsis lyrata]|eukprot:XP_020874831.1 uncharacterized protein LOC9306921 [Arabidopsis lyrata subsp. lyrata]